MRAFLAFMKKEWMEQLRSERITVLAIIFVLLGVMNPAVAKLTPWLFEVMAESLAESGMTVTAVTVDAMTSWTQFFKNIPMGLIAFILLESSIFTREYQSGTLVLPLTKGLDRYKAVAAKTAVLTVLWSVCYLVCFGITYAYNGFFWDNDVVNELFFSVFLWWLLGMWAVMLTVLFSAAAKTNTIVLCGTGGVFLAVYVAGFLPKIGKYLPSHLMDSSALLSGAAEAESYFAAAAVTGFLCIMCFAVSIPVFNKRQL